MRDVFRPLTLTIALVAAGCGGPDPNGQAKEEKPEPLPTVIHKIEYTLPAGWCTPARGGVFASIEPTINVLSGRSVDQLKIKACFTCNGGPKPGIRVKMKPIDTPGQTHIVLPPPDGAQNHDLPNLDAQGCTTYSQPIDKAVTQRVQLKEGVTAEAYEPRPTLTGRLKDVLIR